MGTQARYEFVCPDCGERVLVDQSVHDLLLVEGCAVCGRDVSEAAFSTADGE